MLRRREILPHLRTLSPALSQGRGGTFTLSQGRGGTFTLSPAQGGEGTLVVDWTFPDGTRLHLRANFSAESVRDGAIAHGETLYRLGNAKDPRHLPPWGGFWTIERA